MMDRSPGNLAAMKDAIRKYYRNDVNALRKAWGDEKLTFETITFPTKEAYNRHRFLRDPNDPEARKIIADNTDMAIYTPNPTEESEKAYKEFLKYQ